jgi:hypothetical protein
MRACLVATAVVLLGASAGCGSPETDGVDAGAARDAATPDASKLADVGAPFDTGIPADAAAGMDAEIAADGGSAQDARLASDAGTRLDAQTQFDVGIEAASDGGADSGRVTDASMTATCVGIDCVRPTNCQPSAPASVFRSQTPPPPSVEWGSSFAASLTFANCSGSTWRAAVDPDAPAGVKLGSQAPADNDRWGTHRVVLPADVPSGSEVTIDFVAYAPPLTGSVDFSWQIVDEGIAWLGQASPTVSVHITAAAGTALLCPGVSADTGGQASAAAAIQSCIDGTPENGTLALAPGIYRIDAQLHLTRPITLRTAGLSPLAPGCFSPGTRCATLQADPNLDVELGLITLGTDAAPTHDVIVEHLVIDGNRSARTISAAALQCAQGHNAYGMNATAQCQHCTFTYSASVRALCGTALGFQGNDPTITFSDFRDNGVHVRLPPRFSDGLTLAHADRAVVAHNVFRDNTDVGLVCGGSTDATIADNVILQLTQGAFAGLMLDNFNGTSSGDFTGAVIQGNVVNCSTHLCDFGIELGPHPWYASPNLIAGTVTGNTVINATQGINASGAGTADHPMVVFGNTVSGSATSGTFTCGPRPTSDFNISPDSFVDRQGETSPVTSQTFAGCQ